MVNRLKAASVSLMVIVLITLLKFLLYRLSGSIAVLSEAWHSFSDIATTLLVLISIWRQKIKTSRKSAPSIPKGAMEHPGGSTRRLFRWFGKVDSELKIAGLISIVLLGVSVLLLKQAIFSSPVPIDMPLITGIIFIILSFGSFFLYQFQDSIGRDDNSAALRADSLHNRADMAISLLTGAACILYHFGYDLDRWVGVCTSIFIFTFAIEMLVNVTASMAKGGRSGLAAEYRFNEICRKAMRSGTYTGIVTWSINHFSISGRKRERMHRLPGYLKTTRQWLFVSLAVALGTGCLKSMIYTVAVDEEAIVLRFGKMVQSTGMVGPGLHVKLPWPIDRVERFRTRTVFSLAVGNQAGFDEPMIWRNDHGDTTTFISGDNTLFLPYLIVHYRIKNPCDYYLNYRGAAADKLLEYQAYRILSRIFAEKEYFDITLFRRRQWTANAERELQEKLDEMKAGIEIVAYCLKDLHPPKDISASYENVVAAYQEHARSLNHAYRYYDTTIPEARSDAFKHVNNAHGEVEARIKQAEGEAEHYRMRWEGYTTDTEIGKTLLIHKAAETHFKGKKLFLVDPRSGIDAGMIYFENHISKEPAK
jgi:membrane protease subunit HflK